MNRSITIQEDAPMKKKDPAHRKRHIVRNVILIVLAVLVAAAVGYYFISGWVDSMPKFSYAFMKQDSKPLGHAAYPEADFAVMSDLHYYDASLGTSGKAFEDYLNADRKLLTDSAALLDMAVGDILASKAKFVLVSGDLTKDGELADHEKVAQKLGELQAAGLKVYVVPGNHDILNPDAFSYDGDGVVSIPNATPADFERIYQDFGYSGALYRHSGSLSYVAEPVSGLWLLALDGCRYAENAKEGGPVTGGKLTQSLVDWIEQMLQKAGAEGKAVMVMSHHGIVEHWKGQGSLHPEYLFEDYTHISEMFAHYGVRVAFTGHYHAQDAATAAFGAEGSVTDVETGSLVTPPCPVRFCTIDASQKLSIDSLSLISALHPGTDFAAKAQKLVFDSVRGQAYDKLRSYGVAEADAGAIADAVGSGFVAHYSGDEVLSSKPPIAEDKLQIWSRVVLMIQRYVVDGLWVDLPPADNDVDLELAS
jgi:3',5'-cyclic AMP phosphodiesterase CpdA